MGKTQQRQRGTIEGRGDRKWLVRVFTGRDALGKRKYSSKVVQGTYKMAEQALTQMLREIDTQTFVAPSKDTVGTFVQTWLDNRANIEPRTRLSYQESVDRMVPRIGHLKLAAFNHDACQAFYKKLAADGYSKTTIDHTHSVLNQAMIHAVVTHKLATNPCQYTERPDAKRKVGSGDTGERKVLTSEQVSLLLEKTVEDRYHTIWFVSLMTGLRPAEVLALQWDDLDLDDGFLTVNRTLQKVKAGVYEARAPKTEKSRRTLGLASETVAALKAHKARQAAQILQAGEKYQRQGWVFATHLGTHLDPSNVTKEWKQTLKRLKLPTKVVWYGARHTAATLLLENDGDLDEVSKLLGHSSVRLTSDTYAHNTTKRAKQTADRLAGAIFKKVAEK